MAMTVTRTGIASLVVLAAALVFGVVLGLVLAFGSGETDPWEERWAALGVPEAEFVFLDGVTPDEQESIRQELKAAQVVFLEHFGAVTSDFTVYVSTDLHLLNRRLAEDQGQDVQVRFTCGGTALAGAVAIVLEDCGPETRSLGGPMAHEYFHILQGVNRPEVVGTVNPGAFPPLLWHQLVEGSAVYASAVHRQSRGRWPLGARIEGARLSWAALGANPSVDELSQEEVAAFVYDGGLLMTEWLVAQAGPEAILKFFRTGAHRAAFEGAFGLSVDAFVTAFEAHRLDIAPPFKWRIAGTVLDADDMPVGGVNIAVSVRIAGERWPAGSHTTGEGGAFEFLGPGGGYSLVVWFQCSDADDTWGRTVLVGEFGKEGFVDDDDGVYESEEEGAAPFEGEDQDRIDLLIQFPRTRAELEAEYCES